MTELRKGDQLIHFDCDATVLAYSKVQHGDADRCTCSGCRNFALLRDKAYPDTFRDLLNTIGIDSKKEGEAVHYGPKGDLHFYGGWFYFVGKLVEPGERRSNASDSFQYWIGTSVPRPPSAFGERVPAVEFTTLLPWVLDEPYDPIGDAQAVKAEEIMKRYPKTLQKLANSE